MTFSFISNLRRQRLLIQAFALAALLLAAGIFEKAHATSAGALHLPFGNGGKLTTDVSSYDFLNGMALQPDGKIILAGYTSGGGSSDFLLIRYNANGTLDQTFGSGGKVITNFGSTDIGGAVVLQADGKIVAGGATWVSGQGYVFALARYNPNGTLDTTFGAAGMIVHRVGTMEDQITSLALQADGKIIAAGYTMTGPNADTSFAVARYNTNGSVDTDFGTGGKATTDFYSFTDVARAVALQADGKIVLAGYANNASGSSNDFALVRYNSNGSPDATFGNGGKVTPLLDTVDKAHALALQADGKIVVAGESYPSPNGTNFLLMRYDINGSLDTSFDSDGMVTTNFYGFEDVARALAIQPDGKIIAGGWAEENGGLHHSALARYHSDGSLDNFFGNGGKVLTRYSMDDYVHALAIQPDGNILTAGYASSVSTGDFTLARYVGAAKPTVSSDFDGDGKTDFAVFRPTDGSWYITKSSGGFASYYFGQHGDFVVPADYDGDGKCDVAIWRRDFSINGQSVFYVLRSSDNNLQVQPWGNFRDLPVQADYEGDGKADFAVYRNGMSGEASAWYIRHSSDGSLRSVTWGNAGDIPQPVGDRDGDGKADLTVRRFAPGGTTNDPHPATFYTLLSSDNSLNARAWGVDRDREAHGDYDGDGKMDIGVYRWGTDPLGSPGTFYILKNNGESITQHWGSFGDFSTPGDYDGDGLSDLAVWRPSEGVFYVMKSTGGILTHAWGKQGDLPTTVFLGN